MAATEQTLWTAVLFDFDGTLGDSIDLIISSLRATAAELPGYTVDEAAIRPWIGRPLTAMLVEQGVTDHAEWMNVYRRHYRRAHDQLLRVDRLLVGADNTQRHKPDPEPLLHAAGLLDAVPSRCVCVGDAVTDVVAGRAAGMATIAVTWGAATTDDLADAGPTAVVSSVAELAAQLLIDSR